MQSNQIRLMTLVRMLRDCCQKKEAELCRQLSLNTSQYSCLILFPGSDDVSVNRLSRIMNLSPSRTSRIVDVMVRTGFLVRRTPDSDRRSQLLALSPKGREAKQAIDRFMAECESRLLERIPDDRIPEIQRGIQALIEAF